MDVGDEVFEWREVPKNTLYLKPRRKLNFPLTKCKGGRAGLSMTWNVDSESCEVWKKSGFSKQIMDQHPVRTRKQELIAHHDHAVCTSSADQSRSATSCPPHKTVQFIDGADGEAEALGIYSLKSHVLSPHAGRVPGPGATARSSADEDEPCRPASQSSG